MEKQGRYANQRYEIGRYWQQLVSHLYEVLAMHVYLDRGNNDGDVITDTFFLEDEDQIEP